MGSAPESIKRTWNTEEARVMKLSLNFFSFLRDWKYAKVVGGKEKKSEKNEHSTKVCLLC